MPQNLIGKCSQRFGGFQIPFPLSVFGLLWPPGASCKQSLTSRWSSCSRLYVPLITPTYLCRMKKKVSMCHSSIEQKRATCAFVSDRSGGSGRPEPSTQTRTSIVQRRGTRRFFLARRLHFQSLRGTLEKARCAFRCARRHEGSRLTRVRRQ